MVLRVQCDFSRIIHTSNGSRLFVNDRKKESDAAK